MARSKLRGVGFSSATIRETGFQPVNEFKTGGKPVTRSAFTLLELLLVLVLVASLAAMAMPSMSVLLADSRIRRAGDQVRIVLAQARLEAMRTGQTQVFRCQIGTSDYTVTAYSDASDLTETAEARAAIGTVGTTATAIYQPPDPQPTETEQLPESIVFEDQQVASSLRAMQINEQAAIATDTSWSAPILLYADGTTSTATVRVKSDDGSAVTIQLRGLTGDATVSEVSSE